MARFSILTEACIHQSGVCTFKFVKKKGGTTLEQEIYAGTGERLNRLSGWRRFWEVAQKEAFWAAVTVGAAIASCTFQYIRYQDTIQGVLITWPIIGLAFAIIKTCMFGVRWHRLTETETDAEELYRKRGKILFNISGLVTLMITNVILLTTLIDKGVEAGHWTTYCALFIFATTVIIWYFKRHKKIETQLLVLGTGINIIPTYLQGFSYLFRGANGMPAASVLILIGMSYSMHRQSLPRYSGVTPSERRTARRRAIKAGLHPEVLLPKWDFRSQLIAFGICWGLATFIIPHLGISWWPFM